MTLTPTRTLSRARTLVGIALIATVVVAGCGGNSYGAQGGGGGNSYGAQGGGGGGSLWIPKGGINCDGSISKRGHSADGDGDGIPCE